MALINYTINYYRGGNLYQTKPIQEEMNGAGEHVISIQDNTISIPGYYYDDYNLTNANVYDPDYHGHILIRVQEGAIIDLNYSPNFGAVQYFANGGTVSEKYTIDGTGVILDSSHGPYYESCYYGELKKPADPNMFGLKKEGYVFIGWKNENGYILKPNEEYLGQTYGDIRNHDAIDCFLDAVWGKEVKGKWTFNDTLTEDFQPNFVEEVNFTCAGKNRGDIKHTYAASWPNHSSLSFGIITPDENLEDGVYLFEEYTFEGELIESGWADESYKTIDFGETRQGVTEEFYNWLIKNAQRHIPKTVKGKWMFNEVLKTVLPVTQDVDFTSGNSNYVGFFIGDKAFSSSSCALCYKFLDETLTDGWGGMGVYFYEEGDGVIGWEIWVTEEKTVDFGETEQTVSDEFYAWLVENAVTSSNNIKINITENGTTTLATAGKYCDRNIDVNVTVPTYEDEVAKQKAITDSIADRTITEFTSNTLKTLEAFSFYYCASLHTINCPSVWAIYTRALGYTALKRVDFPGLATIKNTAFEYSKLETLIIRTGYVCSLSNTNAFSGTPIANGTGYIYVPDNLVESYKTATNWVTYASQIKPISELEE